MPGIKSSTNITGIPFSIAFCESSLANKDFPIPLSPLRITPKFLRDFSNLFNTLFAFSS